ncbi:MAG: pantoate--beta-alanine ligase [Rickettsiales bacterium]|nr:pantoate--beta-alanine ligase [Rickettsiales bacterium]
MVKVINNVQSLRAELGERKRAGESIGFVPTMGALHEGHLSLVRKAHAHADTVVVSIFVNPTQFAPDEDFDTYPRTVEADTAKLEAVGVDIIYLPTVESLYPNGAVISIKGEPSLTQNLCAKYRPGFFDGVATVVSRLFAQVQPDTAIFGEKDYQQLQVIKRMVADLALPIEIVGAPIAREESGLALSSRNAYLSEEDRAIALRLQQMLQQVAAEVQSKPVTQVLGQAKAALIAQGFRSVDYVELVDAQSLQPITDLNDSARLLAAVWLGKTRLIDNIAVEPTHE